MKAMIPTLVLTVWSITKSMAFKNANTKAHEQTTQPCTTAQPSIKHKLYMHHQHPNTDTKQEYIVFIPGNKEPTLEWLAQLQVKLHSGVDTTAEDTEIELYHLWYPKTHIVDEDKKAIIQFKEAVESIMNNPSITCKT